MNKVVRFRSPEQFRQACPVSLPPPRRPLRRVDVPTIDPALTPTDDPLRQRLSDELDFAWRQLQQAVSSMQRDSLTAARHGPAVRTVDAVGQALGQLAVVLRSSRPELAVERVPSADLRRRLQRTGGVS